MGNRIKKFFISKSFLILVTSISSLIIIASIIGLVLTNILLKAQPIVLSIILYAVCAAAAGITTVVVTLLISAYLKNRNKTSDSLDLDKELSSPVCHDTRHIDK